MEIKAVLRFPLSFFSVIIAVNIAKCIVTITKKLNGKYNTALSFESKYLQCIGPVWVAGSSAVSGLRLGLKHSLKGQNLFPWPKCSHHRNQGWVLGQGTCFRARVSVCPKPRWLKKAVLQTYITIVVEGMALRSTVSVSNKILQILY